MQKERTSLGRITLLYCLFFVVILLCAFISFNEVLRTVHKDAQRMFAVDERGRESTLLYDLPVATSETDFNIPIMDKDNATVNARASRLDVEVVSSKPVSHSTFCLILSILISVAYVSIFILMILVINNLRKSIKRGGSTFSRRMNMIIRGIGILLIAASLLLALVSYIEARSVADMFAGSGYKIDTSFKFNLPELIAGIMIFVVAEVFSVGKKISDEQRFTI